MVVTIVAKIIFVIASLVGLPCGCLVLELVIVVTFMVCAVVLEVVSSTFVAWSWFLHGFDLSDS